LGPGWMSCNMCRGGLTALGSSQCKNGCPCYVFPDGTVLSYRYAKVKASGDHPTGFGDVWGHQLHRGRMDGTDARRFERIDTKVYDLPKPERQ